MTEPCSPVKTTNARILAVLEGKKPDRLPFADRLEIWFRHHQQAGTLPAPFQEMSLSDAHHEVGMGEQVFAFPLSFQLHGVQMVSTFEGETIHQQRDPVVNHFPDVYDAIPSRRVGITTTEFITPMGKLVVQHEAIDFMIEMGIERPYLLRHPIQEEADYRTVEYIIERAQPQLAADRILAEQARVGEDGYVVPLLRRIPFQQLLLEYLGEEALFYALHDSPSEIDRLLNVLDAHFGQMLDTLADLPVPYVEFCDNLEGAMTNPRLYAEYCLPYHQRYVRALHAQGKKVGSHTDGNLKRLLDLLAQSGLDVCESVTPAPMTECTLTEILEAWETGPVIWGGIPSSVLDPAMDQKAFEAYVEGVFQALDDRPIIVGIGDLVMPECSVERLQYIAEQVEQHAPGG
jgi:uroporphyrinogen-III decarboxylase